MNPKNIVFLIVFLTLNISWAQETDSIVYIQTDWKKNSAGEGMISYEFSNPQIIGYYDSTQIGFFKNRHFLGWEQSYSSKWSKGSSAGIRINWLIGGKDQIESQKLKLKGFRFGMSYGYKLKLFEFLTIEPNICTEYGNFRIKNVSSKSKIKTHGLNLCGNIDLRIMFKPFDNGYGTGTVTPLLSLSFGYLWNPFNSNWSGTADSKAELSAPQISWSGWCFKIKFGMIQS